METYVILRRCGWQTSTELEEATARSVAESERTSDDVVSLRSYVLAERNGTGGMVCICQAPSPEAIRAHATRADLPVDEIIKVVDTIVVNLDPVPMIA